MSMTVTVTRQQKMLSALKRRHMEIVGDTAKDKPLKASRDASSFLQQLPLSRIRTEYTELPGLTPGGRSAATVPALTRRRAGVDLRPDGLRRSRGADWMRLVRIASKCLTTWDRIRNSNLATTVCQAPAGERHRGSGEEQARPGYCALQQTVAMLQQEKDAAVQAKDGLEV